MFFFLEKIKFGNEVKYKNLEITFLKNSVFILDAYNSLQKDSEKKFVFFSMSVNVF